MWLKLGVSFAPDQQLGLYLDPSSFWECSKHKGAQATLHLIPFMSQVLSVGMPLQWGPFSGA